MCGICGEVKFSDAPASLGAVEKMADAMISRGPDDSGTAAYGRAALGHRRLKIIDLTQRSRQPMHDAELGLTLAFNGCIYNHRELRRDLEGKGYRFFSDSDTEVILKAYHAWGTDCVQRFNGMFAFAIHERDSGRLVLARDRLGIKPLYLSAIGNGIRFASSLPALLAAGVADTGIDPVAFHHYMTFHAVVPAPFTMIAGVRKLPPATIAVFEADGRRTDTTYWRVEIGSDSDDIARPEGEWVELVRDALETSVRRRMIADVPVGVLLSGGLDSSLIVGLLARAGVKDLKTFSIGFDSVDGEEGDEFRYSDAVVEMFKTDHHQMRVAPERVLEALPKAISAMSEPMVSHDVVAFHLLSEEVSKHVTVVQSGQGADEVFAGYHWYPPLVDSNDALGDYAQYFFDRDHPDYARCVDDRFVDGDHSLDFVREHFAQAGADRAVDKALRIDQSIMLVDDPVKRVDNMTMAWGLEARVPFLDHELVELAGRVPAEHKMADGGKGILKKVARGVVPDAVIDRPKGYFPVPALKYLEGEYLDRVREAVTGAGARRRRLFKPDFVDELLASPKDHITRLRGSKLWQVAVLESWLDTHGL